MAPALLYKEMMKKWIGLVLLLSQLGCHGFNAPTPQDLSSAEEGPYYPTLEEAKHANPSPDTPTSYKLIQVDNFKNGEVDQLFAKLYEVLSANYGAWAGMVKLEDTFIENDQTPHHDEMAVVVRTSSDKGTMHYKSKLELCTAKDPQSIGHLPFDVETYIAMGDESIQKFTAQLHPPHGESPRFFKFEKQHPAELPGAATGMVTTPHSDVEVYGVCAQGKTDPKTDHLLSICPTLLLAIETRHSDGEIHFKGLLYENNEYHFVPYVDLKLLASTSTHLFDMNNLAVRSAFVTNKKCTIEDILTPHILPDNHVSEVTNEFDHWLHQSISALDAQTANTVANDALEELKSITDEFLAGSYEIIENGQFKRSEVINLSAETISHVAETYSTQITNLDNRIKLLKEQVSKIINQKIQERHTLEHQAPESPRNAR